MREALWIAPIEIGAFGERRLKTPQSKAAAPQVSAGTRASSVLVGEGARSALDCSDHNRRFRPDPAPSRALKADHGSIHMGDCTKQRTKNWA